jgi:hypothetical protein
VQDPDVQNADSEIVRQAEVSVFRSILYG